MENELKQIGWRLRTPEEPFASRAYFSNMYFKPTVTEIRNLFAKYIESKNIENKESRISRFNETMDKCLSIADMRNKLVHSAYIFLESGDETLGIIRSRLGKDKENNNQATFDQEHLAENSFDQPLKDLAELSFEVGQWHVQIIHWS